jgi:hypothetical protein
MKKEKSLYYLCILTIFVLGLVNACNKFDKPTSIYDPNKVYPGDAVIESISPPDSAVAGVREITIDGKNFITNLDSISVYFDSEQAIIKSATVDRLVVHRPPNYGDSLVVKVTIPTRLGIARVPGYKLEQPMIKYGDFRLISRAFYAMEMDNQNQIWISGPRYLFYLTADGLYTKTFMRDDLLRPAFNEPTDIKLGPQGLLYFATRNNRAVYTINPFDSTQAPVTYASFPNVVEKIDFDQNGNIFGGKSNGLYRVDTARTVTPTGHHTSGFSMVEVRVFDDHVYAANNKRIYRTLINPDGTLDTADVLLVDINSSPSLSSCTISSFNLAEDGTVYICLQNHPQYSIFALENDGSVLPFYTDNILPEEVDQIFWDNGRYMYLNQGKGEAADTSRGLYRVGMDKNGAPYLGRSLP